MYKCDGKEVLTLRDLRYFAEHIQKTCDRIYMASDVGEKPHYPPLFRLAPFEDEVPEMSYENAAMSERTFQTYLVEAELIVEKGEKFFSYRYQGIELYKLYIGAYS